MNPAAPVTKILIEIVAAAPYSRASQNRAVLQTLMLSRRAGLLRRNTTGKRVGRPGRGQRLVRALERDNPGLGCSLSPSGILNDFADVEVELGSKLLADSPNFLDNWIMEHY